MQAGFKRKDVLNDGELCGQIGYQLMNYDGDRRRNSYVAFLQGQARDNLTIVTNAQVQRIQFDDQKTATALTYRTPHGCNG
ncbi:MAG: GMC family oxidoreductase N-terminal domain-containing protein [Gammaproteobacteria bacterium]